MQQQHNNEEQTWPHVERRKMPDGVQVTLEDVWGLLKDVNDRLSQIEHRYGYISSAFVTNDLGKPDFDGHRRAHLAQIKTAEVMEGYKSAGTKEGVKIAVAFVLGLLGLGVVEWIRSIVSK